MMQPCRFRRIRARPSSGLCATRCGRDLLLSLVRGSRTKIGTISCWKFLRSSRDLSCPRSDDECESPSGASATVWLFIRGSPPARCRTWPPRCGCPTRGRAPVVRYTRRARFSGNRLAAAQGDHERAAAALATLQTWGVDGKADGEHANCSPTPKSFAAPRSATMTCTGDRFRCGSRYQRLAGSAQPDGAGQLADYVRIAGATAYGRFCVETGRLPEANPGCVARSRAKPTDGICNRQGAIRARCGALVGANQVATEQLVSKAIPSSLGTPELMTSPVAGSISG